MRDARLAANAVRGPRHSFKMLDVVVLPNGHARARITAERVDVDGEIELRCQRLDGAVSAVGLTDGVWLKPRDLRHATGLKLIDGGRP